MSNTLMTKDEYDSWIARVTKECNQVRDKYWAGLDQNALAKQIDAAQVNSGMMLGGDHE